MDATDLGLFIGVPHILKSNFMGREVPLKLRQFSKLDRPGRIASSRPKLRVRIVINLEAEDQHADQLLLKRLSQRRLLRDAKDVT